MSTRHMTIPCCIARCSVSTCSFYFWEDSIESRCSSDRLVMSPSLLTRQVLEVRCPEWELVIAKTLPLKYCVYDVVLNLLLLGAIVRGVLTAEVSTTKKNARNAGTVPMRGRVITNPQDPEALSAIIVFPRDFLNAGKKNFEQRYSQSHWKQWNVSLNYGKGARLLSIELELQKKCLPSVRKRLAKSRPGSTEDYILEASERAGRTEAQKFIDKYFNGIPGVKHYIDRIHFEVAHNKYVESVLGRRRPLRAVMSIEEQLQHEREAFSRGRDACWCPRCRDSRGAERQSVNTIIQGSAADVTMCGMLNCDADPHLSEVKMLFQVHDEVNFEVPREILGEVIEKVKFHMENPGIDLNVPLRAEPEYGDNWVDAH